MKARLILTILAIGCMVAACHKEPEEEKPEVFVANQLSINGGEPITYETGSLADALTVKTITKLEWTDISQMNATDVMALRTLKSTLRNIDAGKVRFIDDGTTYKGYSSDAEKVKPEELPQYFLSGFTQLETAVLPAKVTKLGSCSMSNCKKLTECILPPKLLSMGRYVFHYCTSLSSITLPETFVSINDDTCFGSCTSLESFTFPDATTNPGVQTFNGCTNLKSIHFGENCNPDWMRQDIVMSCFNIEEVTVSSKNKKVKQDGGALATADGRRLLIQPTLCPDGKYVVKGYPENIMFFYNAPYVSIEFAEGCEIIDYCAFSSCKKLTTIIFPSTLKSIARTHPATNGNTSLSTIIVRSATPPAVANDFLSKIGPFKEILVPASSVNAYKAADVWKAYASKIKAGV